MDLTTVIGILASIFTSSCLLPQLIKIIREKKAENISLGMLIAMLTGIALWIYYGFLKDDWIIIISNSFSLLINITTTLLSIKYKTKKSKGNDRS